MKMADAENLRSAIFGIEDALVSTTGTVVGITAGVSDKKLVLLAAIVVVAVEAVSMGVGQFLSAETLSEAEKHSETGKTVRNIVNGSLIMFFSYFLAGLVPIVPVFFLPFPVSILVSLVLALGGLFLLGYIKGKIVAVSPLKSALKILVLGGVAALVGMVVGYYLRNMPLGL